MIWLQGMYRLTFPVTPAEISLKGYGNDTETVTSITRQVKNRLINERPKSLSFDFLLPGNLESPLIEVQGYQGPQEWLAGLERISGNEVLVIIDELNMAWTVLIGSCDGKYSGINGDFHGSIELFLYSKEEFSQWSNGTQLLKPASVISKQTPSRPNTSGKTAKKQEKQAEYLIKPAVQAIQRELIEQKTSQRQ